jgi:hypothetical protein
MAKRSNLPPPGADPTSSYRWSKLFENVEAAEDLFHSPGWLLLLQDLKGKVDEHSAQVVHGLPVERKHDAEQCFFRGKIAAFEDLEGLSEELKEFLADRKRRK